MLYLINYHLLCGGVCGAILMGYERKKISNPKNLSTRTLVWS